MSRDSWSISDSGEVLPPAGMRRQLVSVSCLARGLTVSITYGRISEMGRTGTSPALNANKNNQLWIHHHLDELQLPVRNRRRAADLSRGTSLELPPARRGQRLDQLILLVSRLFASAVPGKISTRWNTPRSNGSTSSTTGVCSSRSAMYHRLNLRWCTIASWKSQPWQLDSNTGVSGIPGVIHLWCCLQVRWFLGKSREYATSCVHWFLN